MTPTDFTVKTVVGEKDWEGRHGAFKDYELFVEGPGAPNATVTLTQKPDTKPPAEGDTIYASIQEGQYGAKLKKAQRDNGGQPSSQGSGDEFARRPDHPDNAARARHSTALGAAPAYYELLRTEGVIPQAESKEKALETLRGLIRWLEDSYPVTNPDDQIAF